MRTVKEIVGLLEWHQISGKADISGSVNNTSQAQNTK